MSRNLILRLPCACRARRDGENVVIEAMAFVCPYRHRQGQRLTVTEVMNMAVGKAVDKALDQFGEGAL